MLRHVHLLNLVCALTLVTNTHASDTFAADAEDLFYQGRLEEACALYEKRGANDRDNPELCCNQALILQKMCRFAQAQEIYESILARNPQYGRALRALSHVHLILGNFNQGWAEYEYRWKNPPAFNQQLRNYIEQGNSLVGKRILIHTEYGLGDTLQFIRYAQKLKNRGAYIILACQHSLIPLLKQTPYIDAIIPQELECACDFQVMLMSLPWVFNSDEYTIPNSIPYLYADTTLRTQWKEKLSRNTYNVGICWKTDSDTTTEDAIVRYSAQSRSIPFDLITPLAHIPGIKIYCLQKITNPEERKQITASGITCFDEHFDKHRGSFMDSAALIKNLDLVITIDTSLAHLAGGLGAQTWLLLPYSPDWRWMLERTDSPWYRTMRLFRQKTIGDWEHPINEISKELSFLLSSTLLISKEQS